MKNRFLQIAILSGLVSILPMMAHAASKECQDVRCEAKSHPVTEIRDVSADGTFATLVIHDDSGDHRVTGMKIPEASYRYLDFILKTSQDYADDVHIYNVKDMPWLVLGNFDQKQSAFTLRIKPERLADLQARYAMAVHAGRNDIERNIKILTDNNGHSTIRVSLASK